MKRDFDVLPLDALAAVLKQPEKHPRALFLMSDDGYANTLTAAAPVLEAMKLPWTSFVSTHHIDTGEFTPPTLTRLFCREAPDGDYEIPQLGTVTLASHEERESLVEWAWDRLKTMDALRGNDALNAMKSALADADLKSAYSSETFLNWDQLRELHARGVEIGAHAHQHWAMHGGQSRAWLSGQALQSKLRIEQEIGPCRFFAYPFGNRGDVGRSAWEAVRDAGYQNAFTTIAGSLDASANPYLLPRYGLAPEEPNLTAFLPVLRANNARLKSWQSEIGTTVP
jgi:peptidoglycan/xylan/chitin deacetylase (PgdA/CDA1 family)